jgi:glycosyltransferase involved in cell wall biosynthesis
VTALRIGIDYTAAARQRAGIGRYTRELVTALLALESRHHYTLFAATGGLQPETWHLELETRHLKPETWNLKRETRGLKPGTSNLQPEPCNLKPQANVRFRKLPLSDDWLARLWHRLRLPIPVEVITGPLDVFYSPDFVLPPTRRTTHTLLTVHDLSFLRYPEAFVPPLRRYLERVVPRSIARADLVLADSAHTRSDLVSLLGVPSERVRVLYSGVHPRFYAQPEPGERERLQARYDLGPRPYVLSVGTLQPRKNYLRLIQAFTNLQPETLKPETLNLPPFISAPQLLLAGGRGWLYQDILDAAERHGDRVRVLGFVDEADLPALYRQAALFVFPSLYEGFGLPVLEAMACGVPVVCSHISSLPEVAGDAALMVDPLDVDALAQAMARVLKDPDLRRDLIARGLVQAARFTWERAARQLQGTFDELGEDELLPRS